MKWIDLSSDQGKAVWQKILTRKNDGADALTVRRDPITLRAFGRAISPRDAVAEIIRQVQSRGDRALIHYLRRLDNFRGTIATLKVDRKTWAARQKQVPRQVVQALRETAGHIKAFHESQMNLRMGEVRRLGVRVYERRFPLSRVGIYVPGGQAPLISSVLMNAIPARMAGVREIIMATPARPDGTVLPAMLCAAELAGVDQVFAMGGAPAMAAMAFGTDTVPQVDKIVGPANIFGVEAKRQLIGQVGIDSLAGPSEILILADETARADWIAWDLLAQGEHGSGAVAILLSASAALLNAVIGQLERICRENPELQDVRKAARLFKVKNAAQAVAYANEYVPEHLSIQLQHARKYLPGLTKAGAVFVGAITAQAMGDYTAGPNHVLPTTRTARWSSPLSVRDFERYSSVIEYTGAGMWLEAAAGITVAEAEGLKAHARSIGERVRKARLTAKSGKGE